MEMLVYLGLSMLLTSWLIEKQLKALMAEQRTKIEEIKKKTNYYTTKNLLDRYDDSPSRKKVGCAPSDVAAV